MNTKYNNILIQLTNARRDMTFAVLDARLVRISDKNYLKLYTVYLKLLICLNLLMILNKWITK